MMLGNRNSQRSFAQVPTSNRPRSQFNRSFGIKDTFNFDELVPIIVDEVLPGDTVNMNVKSFARLAPQVKPLMDNMYIDYFFFFVPKRLVWDNWEKFNGAQDDPDDSTDYLIPTVTAPASGGFTVGSIYDKMGIPTGVNSLEVNVLPLRAYQLIWNEWFRDQNLQDSIVVSKDDGPDANTDYSLLKRAKKHDYFTSALPWPQKGDAVTLPLGTEAPVLGIGKGNGNYAASISNVRESDGSIRDYTPGQRISYAEGGDQQFFVEGTASSDGYPNIRADLSAATAATINDLREAFMVQELLELDARGGTRYVEIIKAHFNVISPDFRLQRPEFLSGGTTLINQHPVTQTSESTTDNPLGNLAAFSTSVNTSKNIGFTKSFTEHGYIIGLVQARADVTYQQGLNRMWSRSTRYDFFWPELQQLGEQTILNKEIRATGTSADDEVFGYQERYAEYRYSPSLIKGQFRSTYAQTLDVWHLAEEFASTPSLNSTFIESNTPIERVLTTATDYPHLLFDCFFDYKHARPMMTYGIPASLGRF